MRAFVVLAAVALSGCIISVTSRRACSSVEPCPDGFTCDAGECLADGSLYIGESCSAARQCVDYPAVTCGASPNTCRVVCDQPLRMDGACIDGEYCRPETGAAHPSTWAGTCFESECATSLDCLEVGDGLSCVAVAPTGRACLERCEITGTGATYADSCGSMTASRYCQPVGPSDHPSLVCLDRLTSAALAPEPGAACDPLNEPCQAGAACVRAGNGDLLCRAYCDATHGDADCTDPTAPHCCEVSSGAVPLYAICQADAC